MNIQYIYTKVRRAFGRHCKFSDHKTQLMVNIDADPSLLENYIKKDPIDRSVQFSPIMSLHEANTTYKVLKKVGLNHMSGGWPKEIDGSDVEQMHRYTKKLRKDEGYVNTVMSLCETMNHCVKQNNVVDIYREYFDDINKVYAGPAHANVEFVLRGDSSTKSCVHLSWFPDSSQRIASAHCDIGLLNYEWMPPCNSFIWNATTMTLETTLKPPSSVLCIEYNPRDTHSLGAALCSGQVAVWDTRKGETPSNVSKISDSHIGVALCVRWIVSKSGTEMLSAGCDGRAMIWDMRKLSGPLESFIVDPTKQGNISNAEAIYSVDYDNAIPSKFLVGTISGSTYLCSRKPKDMNEVVQNAFLGHTSEVRAVQRNPHVNKTFMTAGCYSFRLWHEDIKEFPILLSPYQFHQITAANWSPTRPSVYMASDTNGCLALWDLIYCQSDPVLRMKVTDKPINCIRPTENGKLLATGSACGLVNILCLSEGFYMPPSNEKANYVSFVDREVRKEKILDAKIKEIRIKTDEMTSSKKLLKDSSFKPATSTDNLPKAYTTEELLDICEKEFFSYLEEIKKEYIKKREMEAAKKKAEVEEEDSRYSHGGKSSSSSFSSDDNDFDTYRQELEDHKKKIQKKVDMAQSKDFSDEEQILKEVAQPQDNMGETSKKRSVRKRVSVETKPSSPSKQRQTTREKLKSSSSRQSAQEKGKPTSPSLQRQSSTLEKTKPTSPSLQRQSSTLEKTKPTSRSKLKQSSGEKSRSISPSMERPSLQDKAKSVSPSMQKKTSSAKRESPSPSQQRQTTADIDSLTSPSPQSPLLSPKQASPIVEESQENTKDSNNSALDGINMARLSENNSNLAEWEITPRQVLSRIINNSRILTLNRTSQRFQTENVTALARFTSPVSSNKVSESKEVCDQENQLPSDSVE